MRAKRKVSEITETETMENQGMNSRSYEKTGKMKRKHKRNGIANFGPDGRKFDICDAIVKS